MHCMNKNFIVVALEISDPFTDSRPPDLNKDLPIELAAVKVKDGRICDTFSSFIGGEGDDSRGIFLDEWVTARTGITDFHLLNAPVAPRVFASFKAFVGDNKIIVRNVADRRALLGFMIKYCGVVNNEVVRIYDCALSCGNTDHVPAISGEKYFSLPEDKRIMVVGRSANGWSMPKYSQTDCEGKWFPYGLRWVYESGNFCADESDHKPSVTHSKFWQFIRYKLVDEGFDKAYFPTT